MAAFDCFCGAVFPSRQALVDHNVTSHGWEREESRRRVTEKYPEE